MRYRIEKKTETIISHEGKRVIKGGEDLARVTTMNSKLPYTFQTVTHLVVLDVNHVNDFSHTESTN